MAAWRLETAAVSWSKSVQLLGPEAHMALGEGAEVLPLALVMCAVMFVVQIVSLPLYEILLPGFLQRVKDTAKQKQVKAVVHKPEAVVTQDALNDVRVRTVSFTFSLVVCYGAVRIALFPPEVVAESRWVSSPPSIFYCTLAVAYFIWDLPVTLYYQYGFAFLMHAVLCLLTFLVGLRPYSQMAAIKFLLFELSTPLLNLRCLMLAGGLTNNTAFSICNTLFAVTFLIVRIFFGLPMSWQFASNVAADLLSSDSERVKQQPILVPIAWFLMFVVVALCSLNIFWALSIVRSGLRRRKVE